MFNRWKAKLPTIKPRDGAVYVVFGFKDSGGGRHELSGEFPAEAVKEVFEQLVKAGNERF